MPKKILSTFEREMEDSNFKASFDKEYKDFLLSELLQDLMEESNKSVRKLASEVDLSPTVIQNVRSGKQENLMMTNFLNIAAACGYHVFLEKGSHRIEM